MALPSFSGLLDFISGCEPPYVEPMGVGRYWRMMTRKAARAALKVADWTPGKIVLVVVAFAAGAGAAYALNGPSEAAQQLWPALLYGLLGSVAAVAVLFLLYLFREPHRLTVELVDIIAVLERHLRQQKDWRDVELELARFNSMADSLLHTEPTQATLDDWQKKYVRWSVSCHNVIAMHLGPTWADKFYSVDTLASGDLRHPDFEKFALNDHHRGSLEFLFARKRNLLAVMEEVDRRAVQGTSRPPVPPLSETLAAHEGRPRKRRGRV